MEYILIVCHIEEGVSLSFFLNIRIGPAVPLLQFLDPLLLLHVQSSVKPPYQEAQEERYRK